MKKQIFAFAGLLLLLLTVSWQTHPAVEDYPKMWARAEQYAQKDLPRSALKVIQKIYTKAKTSGNESQIIKSLLYRISMESRFEENVPLKSIRLFETELKTATPVERALLYSLLGQLYQGYYSTHLRQILDRKTHSLSDTALQSMDARQWQQKTTHAYLASVKSKQTLSRIPLKDFKAILQPADSTSLMLWPTLYDLLAHRAIDYFSGAGISSHFPGPVFSIDTALLAPLPAFLNLDFSKDTLATTPRVLQLFQHLLRYHLQDKDTLALVDANLGRLAYGLRQLPGGFVYRKAYTRALNNLWQQYKSHPVSVRIAYTLAQAYTAMDRYHPAKRNPLLQAEKICRQAVHNFPDAPFSAQCKNLLARLNAPSFSFETQQALLPGKPFLSKITVKNVNNLWFKVIRIPAKAKENTEELSRFLKRRILQPPVKSWKQEFPFSHDLHKHTAEVAFPALPLGTYVIFASDDPKFSKKSNVFYRQIEVTQLALLSQKNNRKKALDFYVLNRQTGMPVPDAAITVSARTYDYRLRRQKNISLGNYSTDATGFVQIAMDNNDRYNGYLFRAVKNGDTTLVNTYASFYGTLYRQKAFERTYFFTDRAIYRPGQTVYFKAVQVTQKGNDARIKPGEKLLVKLMSPQYKKLDEWQLVTDSSGAVNGSFVLPSEALNGRFLLQTSTGSKGILMENYKRPAFYIAFDTLKKGYALNDTVLLNGKVAYYFGGRADSLPVKYTVTRESYFPVFYGGQIPLHTTKTQIAAGRVFTGSDGRFNIHFTATSDAMVPQDAYPVYRFVLHVRVTDVSGETHTATKDIRVSRLSVLLRFNMPRHVVREQSEGIAITTKNLMGDYVPAVVDISLFRLTPPGRVLLPPLWPAPDTVLMPHNEFVKTFPHLPYMKEADKNRWPATSIASIELSVKGQTLVFPGRLASLKPGYYLVTAQVKGQAGATVKHFFTVSSMRSKKLPVRSVFWHSLSATKAQPGDVLTLQAGSAAGKMNLLFEVLNGKEIVRRQWFTTGKKLTRFAIPVAENYRGNFFLRLTGIWNNRFFTSTQKVDVPFTNKKLQIGLETYRNFLKPGKKEQWTLRIGDLSARPQKAFVIAGMYDASLDVYAPNRWKMFPYRTKTAGPSWQAYLFHAGYGRFLFSYHIPFLKETVLTYPAINWFGYPLFSGSRPGPFFSMAGKMQKAVPVARQSTAVSVENSQQETKAKAPEVLPTEKKSPPEPLRTHFNETAFFYPDLKSDKNGKVSFSFTVPDALTQWKFMVMAYTPTMKTGFLVKKIAARKALMILPHLPRFVRQGDRLLFTARLSNLSGKTLPVKVHLQFFDPLSGKNLSLFLTRESVQRNIMLRSGKTERVSWWIHIPDSLHMLGYRIQAVSGNNADGEQRMIPVLTNRQRITETLPLFVNGRQQKTFVFNNFLKKHSATLKNFSYTITFTSHPAWYAVQALPSLNKPEFTSAEDIFYSYYARALAHKLLQTYPRIQTVFEQWKKQSPEAFLSELQKNKSLKDIVLQATPWLLEARDETEQKRRVALFFDLNQMQHKQQTALLRLQTAQLPSGAWSWFPGMPADLFTSQNILSGLSDLVRFKALDLKQQPEVKTMMQKGIRYVDHEMLQKYRQLQKRYPKTMNKNHLTSGIIRYCSWRTGLLTLFPVNEKNGRALDYFTGQIRQYWPGLDNNLQALSALALNRSGYAYDAEAILRALTEKSLLTAQKAMYWRNDKPYASQGAVSTEVNILKAFAEIMHDSRSVERMKTWLILQKQATRWPGTKATADAVFALLMNGQPLLKEMQPVSILLGSGKSLSPKTVTYQPGTGFISKTWFGQEISPSLGTITVKNPNKGMAYGAVYWQYFEALDKVTGQKTAVSLQKTLFREDLSSGVKRWVAITPNETLHTGDRIMVRLIIRSGRSVDFIHLEDMHAAAFEPETLLSGYRNSGGLWYYLEIKDAATHFFIRHLPKGTFVLEYPLLVTQKGTFSNGIARIQSLYLPSFAAHSSGNKIKVE